MLRVVFYTLERLPMFARFSWWVCVDNVGITEHSPIGNIWQLVAGNTPRKALVNSESSLANALSTVSLRATNSISAIDRIQDSSKLIYFIHIFILAPDHHGNIVINRCPEVNLILHIACLSWVSEFRIICITWDIVEHEEGTILALPPITW